MPRDGEEPARPSGVPKPEKSFDGRTPEGEDTDAAAPRKSAQVSADQLSALFPPLTDRQIEEYAKYLGPAPAEERTWGVRAGTRNLNAQGEDPLWPGYDVPPMPAAEIGLWFRF